MLTDRSNTSPAGVPGSDRVTIMAGTFTITGGAGAIGSQDSSKHTGATVTKTAATTGRYDILTYRPWTRCLIFAWIGGGPASAAFGNTNANTVQGRNPNPTSTTSQGQVQAFLASTGADTELAAGTIVNYMVLGYGK